MAFHNESSGVSERTCFRTGLSYTIEAPRLVLLLRLPLVPPLPWLPFLPPPLVVVVVAAAAAAAVVAVAATSLGPR